MKTLKYYTFYQNNSGGEYIRSPRHGVGEYIIIQAPDAEQAKAKFRTIGESVLGFRNYCPCCGERWYEESVTEEEGTLEPTLYGEPVSEFKPSFWRAKAYVHYYDGTLECYHLNIKKKNTRYVIDQKQKNE